MQTTVHKIRKTPVDRSSDQRGITILEILVVVAIVTILFMVATRVLGNIRHTELRSDTMDLLRTLQRAQSQAAVQGVHYRVVFDLGNKDRDKNQKKQIYRIEHCPKMVKLRYTDEEEEVDEKSISELVDRLSQVQTQVRQSGQTQDRLAAVVDAATPEEALAKAAALEGKRMGSTMCKTVTEGRIRVHYGIRVAQIYVQHLEDSVNEGQVSINFFPLGFAEKAIIEITDDDDSYSVLVHGASGRIELENGQLKNINDHMMRDAVGQRIGKRGP